MNRREFLKTTVFATAGSTAVYAFGREHFNFLPAGDVKLADLAKLSTRLGADFTQLLQRYPDILSSCTRFKAV